MLLAHRPRRRLRHRRRADRPGWPAWPRSVDETAYLAATASYGTEFATGLVDLTRRRGPARLLDVVPGRSGAVLSSWLRERDDGWRHGVAVAALDPFPGYATALRTHLPGAVRVLARSPPPGGWSRATPGAVTPRDLVGRV
jgi:transposase